MAVGQSFRVQRVAVAANTLTPVYPPVTAKCVSVGNAIAADLNLHTHTDESEYLVIAAGWERLIDYRSYRFMPDQIAFWLKSTGTGTAVLLWS